MTFALTFVTTLDAIDRSSVAALAPAAQPDAESPARKPPPMHLLLHLPDSEVAAIVAVGADQQLRLAAACTSQTLQPGTRPAAMGFSQGVTVQVLDAQVIEHQPPLVGRILRARLQAGASQLKDIALPFSFVGPVRLELDFGHHGRWAAMGSGLVARFDGEPHFAESLAC